MGLLFALASALILLPVSSWGIIVDDFQALPATEYDFVIVGGLCLSGEGCDKDS